MNATHAFPLVLSQAAKLKLACFNLKRTESLESPHVPSPLAIPFWDCNGQRVISSVDAYVTMQKAFRKKHDLHMAC